MRVYCLLAALAVVQLTSLWSSASLAIIFAVISKAPFVPEDLPAVRQKLHAYE